MNKIKILTRSGITNFCVKSQKGQQLNMNEVEAITNRKIAGLLCAHLVPKGNNFKLEYNITGYMTLSQYLRSTINKELFASLLYNIYSILQNLQNSHFSVKSVLLNHNQVFVNPSSKSISFVYMPIQYFDNCVSIKDFYLNIAYNGVFAPNESNDYVREYIRILNDGINFSMFELEQYIGKLSGKQYPTKAQQNCNRCNTANSNTAQFCMSCGSQLKHEKKRDDVTYDVLSMNSLQSEKKEKVTVPDDGGEKKKKAETQDFSGGTTVLGDDNGTTVLGVYENEDDIVYPYLLREKNQEKVTVNKPSFRIGKEKQYSDFFVSDNSAVSRSHADIVTRDGRYFIIDRNSTNKTRVEGRIIAPEQEFEIFPGTKLRLANEDFVFNV